MSRIINNPKITNDEIITVNRNAIEHRATWMGISCIEAIKEGADGEKILRSAVAQTGGLHGTLIRDKLNRPIKLDEFADTFLTPVQIKTFEMEFQTKTRDALEIRFHYCPLVSGWLKAGISKKDIPKLCDIAMDGDRNIAKTVGVDFSLGKTIAAGDAIAKSTFIRRNQSNWPTSQVELRIILWPHTHFLRTDSLRSRARQSKAAIIVKPT